MSFLHDTSLVIITNYPIAESCGNKPDKTKLGEDAGHDRKIRVPSIVFTFIHDDFLTNQSVRNKNLKAKNVIGVDLSSCQPQIRIFKASDVDYRHYEKSNQMFKLFIQQVWI